MLQECGLKTGLIDNMKRQSGFPAVDKLAIIAVYLDTSIEYLLGLTDNPTPPKKDFTLEDELNLEISKLTPERRKQATEYIAFLKTLDRSSTDFADLLDKKLLDLQHEQ